MKKFNKVLLVSISIVFIFGGCKSNTGSKSESENVNTQQEAVITESASQNDPTAIPAKSEDTANNENTTNADETANNDNTDGTAALEETTFTSTDGSVVIEKCADYYKVTLDFTKASHYEIGQAYMETIQAAVPDYINLCEQVLYEQIMTLFKKAYGSYDLLEERIQDVSAQMDQEYLDELQGMNDAIVSKSTGFEVDGMLSWEELMAIELLPDVVRSTQCSGVSAYGDKSATGMPVTGRILEWNLGYDKQLTKLISVTEFINGQKSFTSVGVLGNLNGITVYNDDGVFLAMLDSSCGTEFTSKDKRSYSYDIRSAAESFSTANDAAQFMSSHGTEYTFSHNILLSDDQTSMVVENCTDESIGICGIRTADSELKEEYNWTNQDSLCVVNAFVLKGNADRSNPSTQQYRWQYYNTIVSHFDKMTREDIKTALTYDDLSKSSFQKVYSQNTLFMLVVDASDHSIEVAFNPYSTDREKVPEFVKVK